MIWKVELWEMVGEYPDFTVDHLRSTVIEPPNGDFQFDYIPELEGEYKFYVKSYDFAGNWNDSEIIEHIVVDDDKILGEDGFFVACEDDSLLRLE